MQLAEDLNDEELTLFNVNYKEIHNFELKIFELDMAKLYGLNRNQQLQQEIKKAEGEKIDILAGTTMQNCMLKIKKFGISSRAVDVFLRLSLDLVKKET